MRFMDVDLHFKLFVRITLPLAIFGLINQAARTVMAVIGPVLSPAQGTAPTTTVAAQIKKLRERFGLNHTTLQLEELITGATNKEISRRLGMAPKTVMHHSMAIYRKLEVRDRAEAVAEAFRRGLVH